MTVLLGCADAYSGGGGPGGQPPLGGGPVRQGDEQLLQQAPHHPHHLRQHPHPPHGLRLCCHTRYTATTYLSENKAFSHCDCFWLLHFAGDGLYRIDQSALGEIYRL